MKHKKILASFVLLFLILGCVSQPSEQIETIQSYTEEELTQAKEKTKEENTAFFKEYATAINHIWFGYTYYTLSIGNTDSGIELASTEGYLYEDAKELFDVAREQAAEAESRLYLAKKKLLEIRNKAPNQFFEKDITNRLSQTELLINLSKDQKEGTGYFLMELEELAYGSEAEALKYHEMYNALLPSINTKLSELAVLGNNIDLQWEQDWYPN